MEEYPNIYKEFSESISECIVSSRKFMGIPSKTSAHFYASLLFTKLCTASISIKTISPAPELIGKNSHWDSASVATLTRSLIECYLVFFYLCIEKCTSEEWEARWRLMNLHDHMSRTKMFEAMGEDVESNEVAKTVKAEALAALKSSVYFSNLEEKQQKHFLKGNTAFFKSQDEIVSASGGSVSEFRYIYRYLSNNTHSFPMGFYRMAENMKGRGVESESEVGNTGLCILWATQYLKKANGEFCELFKSM